MNQKPTILSVHLKGFFQKFLPLERGTSKHTIRSYSNTFTKLYEFFLSVKHKQANKVDLKDIARENIIEFLDWLEYSGNNKVTTRNSRLASIRAFCHYMQYKDVTNINKWQEILTIKAKKTDQPVVSYLSQEGMTKLLAQIPTDTLQGRRHLAILAFLYDTGARAQELISFTPHNLHLTNPMHVVLTGKGRKKRIVPIHEKLKEILKVYMKDIGVDETLVGREPLFRNTYGRTLTNAGLSYIINYYADMVRNKYPGLIPDKISPHSFRHSKATHLLQAGLNIIYVRDILGHNSVKYTEIYARIDSKQKREAIEKAYKDLVPTPIDNGYWSEDKELLSWLRSLGK